MSMPSRASTSLLLFAVIIAVMTPMCVNALSGQYLIVTFTATVTVVYWLRKGVNALTGQYLIVTVLALNIADYMAEKCQCPHGLVPHCYTDRVWHECNNDELVSMPSRASTSLLPSYLFKGQRPGMRCVNALTGQYLIVTKIAVHTWLTVLTNRVNALTGQYLIVTILKPFEIDGVSCVNALTGQYLIVTWMNINSNKEVDLRCQCPHGLVPHCYLKQVWMQSFMAVDSVNALTGQYLIVTS